VIGKLTRFHLARRSCRIAPQTMPSPVTDGQVRPEQHARFTCWPRSPRRGGCDSADRVLLLPERAGGEAEAAPTLRQLVHRAPMSPARSPTGSAAVMVAWRGSAPTGGWQTLMWPLRSTTITHELPTRAR
jgi:hypothetical protein